MSFSIPESLDGFSAAGLQDLVSIAKNEYAALKSSVTMETVTDEQLDRLEELQAFCFSTVPEELAVRQDKAERFSAAEVFRDVDTLRAGQDFDEAIDLLATTTIPFRQLITGVYPLDGLEKGLLQMEQGADVMKILIDCQS